jgi:hypothetical protein
LFLSIRSGWSVADQVVGKGEDMHINRQIEKFLRDQDMPPTKFGRLAVGDPRLVLDIRMGREIRPAMIAKLERFMTQSAVEPKL